APLRDQEDVSTTLSETVTFSRSGADASFQLPIAATLPDLSRVMTTTNSSKSSKFSVSLD
ncbi:MAG TPA: hypothetical protein VF627_12395, partial [Abditibacterium sp.]